MHVIQAIAKTVIFSMFGLVALGVTAWICRDLIEQPAIMAVILTAACLAAVGPAYVAYFWRNGAKPVSMAVLWLTVLASIVLAYTETSYWSSSIEGMHEQATVEKTARDGQALVTNKRQERYANLANGQTPEQIQAKIDAKAVDARFARSNGCTGATLGATVRAFCAEYFALKADLAAASEALKLESSVWASGTKEEPFLKRNFYQAAMLGSQNLGGTVSAWILGICLVLVVFLGSLLHLGFLIASSPVNRIAARTAAKSDQATQVPLKVFPPAQPRTALPESPIAGLLSRKAGNSSEIPNGSPDPTPPADAALPVEEPKPVETAPARPRLVDENWVPTPPLSKKQRKLVQRERMKDDALRAMEEFVAARLDLDSDDARFVRTDNGFVKTGGTPGTELAKEFRQWAKSTKKWAHFSTYDKNPLGKTLSAVLEQGRPSKGGGSVYAALIKRSAVTEKPVRRAA